MILAALNEYYARLLDDPDSGISPPGYSVEKISYAIVLDREGKVVAVDDIQVTNGKKPVPRGLIVPQRPPGGPNNILPKFLWDKTSYVLGVSSTSKRSEREHAAFKDFHSEVLDGTSDEGLQALLKFLSSWQSSQFFESAPFLVHGNQLLDKNLIFRLDGERVWLHERPAARRLRLALLQEQKGSSIGMCLVTGERTSLTRLHAPIKNVYGGHTAGGFIVSFNEDSYLSYRGSIAKLKSKKNENDSSASAPIAKEVAFAYTTALNHLLRRDTHNRQRLQIGDASVVFWAQADTIAQAQAAESLFAEFIDPKDEDVREAEKVREALEQVRQGRALHDLDPRLHDGTRVFVLGLSPNASRLSVRYWETGTLRAFAERLAAHHEDLRLEPSPWRTPPALWRLLLATAPTRDGKAKSEDVPPQLAGELARAILTGGRYPSSLLGALLMRLRADCDERTFGVRAALIKATLARAKRLGHKGNSKGGPPVSLDPGNTDPGYLLGRLFSSLENIQRAALGKQINATIRDRYYGAASATPAGVFPVLLRNAQHHLSRLRKDKRGYAVMLEKEVGEIVDLLGPSFPKSLGIEAQGHFAIGYYHQSRAGFAGGAAPEAAEETQNPEGEPA
jgi:CRISPR-associated protein Csd1